MRILLYNFVQPEEPGAGGVGVYLGNLARALASDHEVILLSSGDRYSPTRREPRMEHSQDTYRRAVIVNSPVVAPAAYAFAFPGTYLESHALDFVPGELRARYGEIDVFHFQNIEGLTKPFFHRLRAEFPQARMVYSAHNYHPLCLRVSLWYQDREVCVDYRNGFSCTQCQAPIFDPGYILGRRRLQWLERRHPRTMALLSPATQLAKRARRAVINLRKAAGLGAGDVSIAPSPAAPAATAATASSPEVALPPTLPPAPAAAYAAFREGNIELAQDVFDQVLAVSDRTRNVIVTRGMPADKVAVSYIGTAYKSSYLSSTKIRDLGAAGLHLGYIGYMGRDKGFHFLLECLERMPAEAAARITVTVAARNIDPAGHARLVEAGKRFRRLRYFDGYTHANLGEVLDGVNLGLIPVLWEDNLPQTAIELVARGIPILTSDRGGAQEIAENRRFIFDAGNHADFIDRVGRIERGELSLGDFWEGPMRIFSMDEHLADLMRYYAA